MKRFVPLLLMPLASAAFSSSNSWNAAIDSKDPSKCVVSSFSVVSDHRYSDSFSMFILEVYDGARPFSKTLVNLIPKPGSSSSKSFVIGEPAESYFIDDLDEPKNEKELVKQLSDGRRLFVRFDDLNFVYELDGFKGAYNTCLKLVKGK